MRRLRSNTSKFKEFMKQTNTDDPREVEQLNNAASALQETATATLDLSANDNAEGLNSRAEVESDKAAVRERKKSAAAEKLLSVFSAINITRMAVFTALSVVLYLFIKFPLPIFPSFLDMQISEIPAILAGYMMGPWYGAAVIILKCLIKMPMTSTACVGEIADILIGLSYVIPAAYVYKYHRTLKGALVSLAVGAVSMAAMGALVNYAILIPMYVNLFFGGDWQQLINMLSGLYPGITRGNFYLFYLCAGIIPFNLLRGIIMSFITFFTYKQLEKFFTYMFKKDKRHSKELNNHTQVSYTQRVTTKSEAETKAFAIKLATAFTGGEVVLLTGELGAGKTVFAKGIAEALGVKEVVLSPTFTIMNEYDGKSLKFYHYDAYRLSDPSEAEEVGLTQFFGEADKVCLVEWWSNIRGVDFGKKVLRVEIKYLSPEEREITVL